MTSADESDRGRWPAIVGPVLGPLLGPGLGPVLGRALLYALAIVVLVLYGSGEDYVFIYQGF